MHNVLVAALPTNEFLLNASQTEGARGLAFTANFPSESNTYIQTLVATNVRDRKNNFEVCLSWPLHEGSESISLYWLAGFTQKVVQVRACCTRQNQKA